MDKMSKKGGGNLEPNHGWNQIMTNKKMNFVRGHLQKWGKHVILQILRDKISDQHFPGSMNILENIGNYLSLCPNRNLNHLGFSSNKKITNVSS